MANFHRTKLTVDLGQLRRNLEEVRHRIPDSCDIIAVMKADAYGHGSVPLAKALEKEGASRFALATLGEALELREAGVGGELLILSYVGGEDVSLMADKDITTVAASYDHACELSRAAVACQKTLSVHLKVNTGMNRIGFDCATDGDLQRIEAAYSLPGLKFTGIFTHFSSSDDSSAGADPYCRYQIENFNRVLNMLDERGIKYGCRHMSNSGGIQKYPEARYDAVRCGILLSGYNTAFEAEPFSVSPIAEWTAAVTCIRTLPIGSCVSYSRKFTAERETVSATLAVGYADGWPRSLSNVGHVLINGRRARIIGNICMDQMMIDVTDIPNVKVGDTAVLIGRSGELVQTADDVACEASTCAHEILSRIAARVDREYRK